MSSASSPPTAHKLSIWQRVVLWPLGAVLRLWNRSLRFELDPADRDAFAFSDRPVTLVLWHNRLFVAGELIRRCRGGRPFYGLISASKDGAWLAGFFELLGFFAVRGSSSRGAREAVSALLDVARAGHDIGITPDGPRGPVYEFKPGGLIVARRTRAPMLLMGAQFAHAWQLRSWDRLYIPRPFTRTRVRCIRINPDELPRDRDEALRVLTQLMLQVNGEPTGAA